MEFDFRPLFWAAAAVGAGLAVLGFIVGHWAAS